MKLMEVMKPEILRMSLKKSRGKNIKRFVKHASKDANPNVKGNPFTPAATTITGPDTNQDHFSGLF